MTRLTEEDYTPKDIAQTATDARVTMDLLLDHIRGHKQEISHLRDRVNEYSNIIRDLQGEINRLKAEK